MSEYFRAVDPFPLQGSQNTRLAPFYEALRSQKLLTTFCPQCALRHWPPRVVCPDCLSDRLDWIELPDQGTIHAYTIQDTGVPPGFPRPLIFAVVRVEELRIFTRLVETEPGQVERGRTVRLLPSAVGQDPEGDERYVPTFTLARGGAGETSLVKIVTA